MCLFWLEAGFVENCRMMCILLLTSCVRRGIYAYGFEKPSAIQMRAIVPLMKHRDTIAQAQSGMGKTATFVIGILQNIDISLNKVQALILAPTRELAKQIHEVRCACRSFTCSSQERLLQRAGRATSDGCCLVFNRQRSHGGYYFLFGACVAHDTFGVDERRLWWGSDTS